MNKRYTFWNSHAGAGGGEVCEILSEQSSPSYEVRRLRDGHVHTVGQHVCSEVKPAELEAALQQEVERLEARCERLHALLQKSQAQTFKALEQLQELQERTMRKEGAFVVDLDACPDFTMGPGAIQSPPDGATWGTKQDGTVGWVPHGAVRPRARGKDDDKARIDALAEHARRTR